MKTINLEDLTGNGRVHNLSGRLRGLAARTHYALDDFDQTEEDAEVVVPGYVYSLTPSFVQGLFGESLRAAGNDLDRFRQRFRFVAPAIVLEQLERGISAIMTDRDIAKVQ